MTTEKCSPCRTVTGVSGPVRPVRTFSRLSKIFASSTVSDVGSFLVPDSIMSLLLNGSHEFYKIPQDSHQRPNKKSEVSRRSKIGAFANDLVFVHIGVLLAGFLRRHSEQTWLAPVDVENADDIMRIFGTGDWQ